MQKSSESVRENKPLRKHPQFEEKMNFESMEPYTRTISGYTRKNKHIGQSKEHDIFQLAANENDKEPPPKRRHQILVVEGQKLVKETETRRKQKNSVFGKMRLQA